MNDSLKSCPLPEQLKSLVDGSLPESDQLATQSHVDACAECQQALESLVAGSESWDSAVGHLRNQPAGSGETVLSEAIRQMKEEEFVDSADSSWSSKTPLDFLAPSDKPNSIGKLGPYEVTEVVGQGGMGIVVKAFDPALHRVVAVKVLAPYLAHNPQARKRFVREAQAIAAVSHDHVITIHAIDESADQPRIVMQFVSGRSLQQKIDAEGSLDLKEILRIGMQTAAGLAAAHAQGLVHRDVKPSNILLENGIQRVKLTDFGLARAVDDASLTQSGAIAGTPQYMAPEQANGDAVDFRADLFSLGSVLYAMCVGHSPFRASTTMGVLKRVCHDPPRPIQELNADIPDWLCAIVMKLLAKKPEDRFQSAKSVADLLEKWLAHVQQPTVIARPPLVVGAHSASGSGKVSASTNGPVTPNGEDRSASRDLDARTIFFQSVSGRWLLLFLLLGMAGTMAFAQDRRVGTGEAIFVSVLGGLFTCAWGLLIVAIVRLVWANLYGYVPWVAKVSDVGGGDALLDPGRRPPRFFGGLPPESLAMSAAFVVMLMGIHPLFAAIIAIVVWRVAASKVPKTEMTPGDEPSYAAASVEGDAIPISPVPQVPWIQEISDYVRHLLSAMRCSIGKFFGPSSLESNRLLIAIGWCLVGGIDLLFATALSSNTWQDYAPLWFGMSMMSFAVAHCVQARQNFGFVRIASYLGLLPFSFGALGRIPLSIATLFWQNSSAVKESFEATPFRQTMLGGAVHGTLSFGRRTLGTVAWLIFWSTIWGLLIAALFVSLVVPYGPSTYDVYDKSTVTLKGMPDKQFELVTLGSGEAVGLWPPVQSFRRQQLGLTRAGGTRESQLIIEIPNDQPVDKAMEVLTRDISRGLYRILNESYPEHAASLSKAVFQMKAIEDQARNESTKAGSNAASMFERIKRQQGTDHPVKEPMRLGFYLDHELFQVDIDSNVSHFESHPPATLLAVGAVAASLIWLFVSIWIIRRRHFR